MLGKIQGDIRYSNTNHHQKGSRFYRLMDTLNKIGLPVLEIAGDCSSNLKHPRFHAVCACLRLASGAISEELLEPLDWVVCLSCRSKRKASNNRLPTPNHFDYLCSIFCVLVLICLVSILSVLGPRSTPLGKCSFYSWKSAQIKCSFFHLLSYKNSIHSITGSIYWPSCCKVHGRAHNIVDAGIPEHAATRCSEAVHNSIGPRHCIFGKMIHKHHVMLICPT